MVFQSSTRQIQLWVLQEKTASSSQVSIGGGCGWRGRLVQIRGGVGGRNASVNPIMPLNLPGDRQCFPSKQWEVVCSILIFGDGANNGWMSGLDRESNERLWQAVQDGIETVQHPYKLKMANTANRERGSESNGRGHVLDDMAFWRIDVLQK